MYKAWRKKVYVRDGYTCKECGARKRLEAHHIKMWAHFPELRYEVSNGITLCKKCHGKLTGEEELHEERLQRLIGGVVDDIYIQMMKDLLWEL